MKTFIHIIAEVWPGWSGEFRSKPLFELSSLLGNCRSILPLDETGSDENDGDDGENRSEIYESNSGAARQYFLEDMKTHTECLLKLGPALERNIRQALKQRTEQSIHLVPFSVSHPAGLYVLNIREKFPKAEMRLVERLGEANWQRHKDTRKRMGQIIKVTGDGDVFCYIAISSYPIPSHNFILQ